MNQSSSTSLDLESETSQFLQDDDDIEWMLDLLDEEELRTAAETNYAYRISSDGTSPKEVTREYASGMARRYLESKHDREKALMFLKSTLAFRKEIDIRTLVCITATDPNADDHTALMKMISNISAYVQGYDKSGRATFVFIPRRVTYHDEIWTPKALMYTLERAIACSQRTQQPHASSFSESSSATLNVVVDLKGYTLQNAPPMSISKQCLLTLRNHYIGSIHKIFLVNAPRSFLWLWSVLKHFAGSKTREKIVFVDSCSDGNILRSYYDPDQATSWMFPDGKKNRELDWDEYLFEIPFHHAFDEQNK
jgi:hypothetical protein